MFALQKSLGGRLPEGVSVSLEGLRAEKDANISKRKRVDAELKQLNLNIQKLVSHCFDVIPLAS